MCVVFFTIFLCVFFFIILMHIHALAGVTALSLITLYDLIGVQCLFRMDAFPGKDGIHDHLLTAHDTFDH